MILTKLIKTDKAEIWKDIDEYEGFYQVSNLGNIRSVTRLVSHSTKGKYSLKIGKNMKIDRTGAYERIELNKRGKAKKYLIHRIIAKAFIPNPQNLPCVNHIDSNPKNNSITNLEWVTYSENTHHAVINNRIDPSKLYNAAKEVNKKKILDTKTGIIYNSMLEASASLGINYSTLGGYLRGTYKNKTTLVFLNSQNNKNDKAKTYNGKS